MNSLIEKHLYHRKPNLLLENINDLTETTMSSSFFLGNDHLLIQGHFPDLPILPGTQMLEMLVQTAGLHMAEIFYPNHREEKLSVGVFRKCEGAKFVHFGRPEQTISCTVNHIDKLENIHTYKGQVFNEKNKVLMKAKFKLMTIQESVLRG